MKPNEFRIGNLVEKPKGCTHRIERIDEQSEFFGLKITEENLLNMGFKKAKQGNAYWFEKKNISDIEFISNDIGDNAYSKKLEFIFICHEHWGDFGEFRLRYVHQIQNLFFALTGRELEVK